MKIILAGDWSSDLHERPSAAALESLGHRVVPFAWREAFDASMSGRFQNKFLIGPTFNRVNDALIQASAEERPDLLLVYRGTHVTRRTIQAIKRLVPGIVVVGLNNDDPFGPDQPWWLWRHFVASVREYDLLLAYRHRNVGEYKEAGCPRVRLFRSWFVPERNFPADLSPSDLEQFACDVVFIGHFEDDGRAQILEEVARLGYSLRLFGHGSGYGRFSWDSTLRRSRILRKFAPIHPIWGEEYNKAICAAKIALCFLSKLNRDSYTRRCFEIPAAGTMMLSEYSDDLAGLFQEGIEADYFRDTQEFRRKLTLYLADSHLRRQVADAGRSRVIRDGHDVRTRMRNMVDWVDELRGRNALV